MKKGSFANKLLSSVLSLTLAVAMVPSTAFAEGDAGDGTPTEGVSEPVQTYAPGTYDLDFSIDKVSGDHFTMAIPIGDTGYNYKATVVVAEDGSATISYKMSKTSYDGYWIGNIDDKPALADAKASDQFVSFSLVDGVYVYNAPFNLSQLGTSTNICLSKKTTWYASQLVLNIGSTMVKHLDPGDYDINCSLSKADGTGYGMFVPTNYCGKTILTVDAKGDYTLKFSNARTTYDGLYLGTTAEAQADETVNAALADGTITSATSSKYIVGVLNGSSYDFSMPIKMTDLGTSIPVTVHYTKSSTSRPDQWGPYSNGEYTALTFDIADKATGHFEDGDYELTVTTIYGDDHEKAGQAYSMLNWEKYGKSIVHVEGKTATITIANGVDTYNGLYFGTIAEAVAAGNDSSDIVAGTFNEAQGKGYIFSYPFDLELLGTSVDVTPRYVELSKSESGFGPYSKGAWTSLKLVYGTDMKLIETATAETQAIIDGIEALPAAENVTEDDAETVWALRDAYDATVASQQIFVTNLEKLEAVEAALVAQGIVRLPAVGTNEYQVTLGDFDGFDQLLDARLTNSGLGFRVHIYAKQGTYNALYYGAGETLTSTHVTLRAENDYLMYTFDRSDNTSSQFGSTETFTLAYVDPDTNEVTYGPAINLTFPAGRGVVPAATYDQGEFQLAYSISGMDEATKNALSTATTVVSDGTAQTLTVTVPEGKVMVVGKKSEARAATADQYLTGTVQVPFAGINAKLNVCIADAPAAGETVAADAWQSGSFSINLAGDVAASVQANAKLIDWDNYKSSSSGRLWAYFYSTLASWDNVLAVEAAYGKLSDTDQALVDFVNGNMYNRTKQYLTPIKELDDALVALPTVEEATAEGVDTEALIQTVKNLRNTYAGLNTAAGANTAQGAIPAEDLAKLEALEAALGIDADAANVGIDLIFDLTDQTPDTIVDYAAEVNAEYKALTANQKAGVYNYAWLTAALALKSTDETFATDAQALIDNMAAAKGAVLAIADLGENSSVEQVLEAQKAVVVLEDAQEAMVCNSAALEQIAAAKAVVASVGKYSVDKIYAQGSNKSCVQMTKTSASDNMMFRIVDATITVDAEGNMVAEIVASGTGQNKAFLGSKAQAAAALAAGGEGVIDGVACTNSEGKDAMKFAIPLASFDQVICVATYSSKNETWYDRAMVFSSSNLTRVMDDVTQAVIDAINALGDQPTIAAVEAARDAYDALTDDQRLLIPSDTDAKLPAAEAAIEQTVNLADQTKTITYTGKAQTVAIDAATGAKTTVAYSINGPAGITINSETGAITVKGTVEPGTYPVTVTAVAAGTEYVCEDSDSAQISVVVKPGVQKLGVSTRIAAVNYNGSITKASYPIKAITNGGVVVESIATDGTHTAGDAAGTLGTITYSKVSGSEYLTITSAGKTTGKVTVQPKTPVGEYSIVVRVTAAATADGKYAKTCKDVTVKVQVKRFAPTISILSKVTRTVSYTTLKTKSVTVDCPITKIQCASKPMTYELSGAKNAAGKDMKLKFSVNKTTGKVTVAKGTAKGTYTVKIKVMSDDNANYKGNYKIVATTIVVK